jgi:hypothetical protein
MVVTCVLLLLRLPSLQADEDDTTDILKKLPQCLQ